MSNVIRIVEKQLEHRREERYGESYQGHLKLWRYHEEAATNDSEIANFFALVRVL